MWIFIPQIAPIWWTMISLITFFSLILIILVNYFMYTKKIDTQSKNFTKVLTWKW